MTNLHIYPSYLTNESRLIKESKSLIRNKLVERIIITGFWKHGLEKEEYITDRIVIVRFNCYFGKFSRLKFLNSFSFAIFYFKCFFLGVKENVKLINCHTLTLLPLCVSMRFLLRAKLIYDPHELETETHESKGFRRTVARLIERSFIKMTDHCIVVSDSIKEWYVRKYGLEKIEVIKNIPSREQMEIMPKNLKAQLNISSENILFIYQGFLSVSRGVNIILNVFSSLGEEKHIVFMGFGPLEEIIKDETKRKKNIHFLPAAKPADVLNYTAGADVGIHIIPNTCLNHYYCLPNKVFEYVIAGVPFIVSNFPDIKREFETADVAWFVDENEKNFRQVISSIEMNSFGKKKENCRESKDRWSWENQDAIYHKVFAELNQSA